MNRYRMKYFSLTVIGMILLLSPWFLWQVKPKLALNMAIVDKTVPDTSYREHKGLMWLLNQQKYGRGTSLDSYRYDEDYYGFHPKTDQTYEIRDLPANLDPYDLIYITDAYGVFTDDFYPNRSSNSEPSKLIYGGLTSQDLERLKNAVYKGKTLIAEFNTFGSPTSPDVSNNLNKLLGVQWSGWMGRHFQNLSKGSEVPSWVITSYEQKNHKVWDFKGSGFLLISKNNEVIVIQSKDTIDDLCEFKYTESGKQTLGLDHSSRYNYWFDIVSAQDNREVLATYTLNVKDTVKQQLQDKGIPLTFPAIIKHDTGVSTTYYFSGDYSDNISVPSFYQVTGLDKLLQWFTLDLKDSDQAFYYREYIPLMEKILGQEQIKKKEPQKTTNEVHQEDKTYLTARTKGKELQTFTGGKWQTQYIKGVNMGMAVPGKWFTEFPKDEGEYLHWFDLIGKMNSNTIRVYTLMDPTFYRALLLYNENHPNQPLWLLQEIWPEENPPNRNFLDSNYQLGYHKEIENVINAIHGKAEIGKRVGRAYGTYSSEISPYVLGYLVGRELEPEEVNATNDLNKSFSFHGHYLSAQQGSPTENWLAESCDYVLQYEEKTYQWQHPVAIVSWPTLDPINHDSEWNAAGDKSKQYNDSATVDSKHIQMEKGMKAGFFGAYHIYPNYPDFMNNDEAYDAYQDEQGRFRYGGYLKQFMSQHGEYPAVVAEFGLATGMATAHISPDGYNHGGLTEDEQGKGIVRMMQAIQREGYAGGLVFEWMDEWAKKTWVTEPFMIPYDRHASWHNAIDPEQNYGILAMESQGPDQTPSVQQGNGNIQKLQINADNTYVYLDVTLGPDVDIENQELLIGLDTYAKDRGETRYRSDIAIQAPTGMEFLLDVRGKNEAKLLVEPSYNIGNRQYSSKSSQDGKFEEIKRLINRSGVTESGKIYGEHWEDGSTLHYGDFIGSFNQWYIEQGHIIHFRIPWGRLNVTDPSTLTVLDDSRTFNDEPVRDALKTTKTEGIGATVLIQSKNHLDWKQFPSGTNPPLFTWKGWNIPTYKERLKESYFDIQKYFRTISN